MERLTNMKCESCGAPLEYIPGKKKAICPYCGRVYLIEPISNEDHSFSPSENFNPVDWKFTRIEDQPAKIDLLFDEDLEKAKEELYRKVVFFSVLSLFTEYPYKIVIQNALDHISKYSEDDGASFHDAEFRYSYYSANNKNHSDWTYDSTKLYLGDSKKPLYDRVLYDRTEQLKSNRDQREYISKLLSDYPFESNEKTVLTKTDSERLNTPGGLFRKSKEIQRTWYTEYKEQKAVLYINPVNAKTLLGEKLRSELEILRSKDYTKSVISDGSAWLNQELAWGLTGVHSVLFNSAGIGPGYIKETSSGTLNTNYLSEKYMHRTERNDLNNMTSYNPVWKFSRYGMSELENELLLTMLTALICAGIIENTGTNGLPNYTVTALTRKRSSKAWGSGKVSPYYAELSCTFRKTPVFEEWL